MNYNALADKINALGLTDKLSVTDELSRADILVSSMIAMLGFGGQYKLAYIRNLSFKATPDYKNAKSDQDYMNVIADYCELAHREATKFNGTRHESAELKNWRYTSAVNCIARIAGKMGVDLEAELERFMA